MEVFGFLKLFAAYAMWRYGGSKPAGRGLVDALGSKNENLRTIAGIFLVKGGRRAGPLLLEAIEKRRDLPLTLTLLADLGDHSHAPVLRRHVDDRDPEAARAAAQALRVLEFRRPQAEGRSHR